MTKDLKGKVWYQTNLSFIIEASIEPENVEWNINCTLWTWSDINPSDYSTKSQRC